MSIYLKIEGQTVKFRKFLPKQTGRTSSYYRDKEKKLFLKKPKNGGLLRKEVEALNRLTSHPSYEGDIHFPRLVYSDDKYIVTPYIRRSLVDCIHIPVDTERQAKSITRALNKAGIEHNDVHKKNFMIENGTIILIDFGRAKESRDPSNRRVVRVLRDILYRKPSIKN